MFRLRNKRNNAVQQKPSKVIWWFELVTGTCIITISPAALFKKVISNMTALSLGTKEFPSNKRVRDDDNNDNETRKKKGNSTKQKNKDTNQQITSNHVKKSSVKNNTSSSLPLHFCVYRKEVNDYVFLPAGYGRRYYSIHKHSRPPFCKHCHLQPCMNAEYSTEIYGEGHKMAGYIDTTYPGAMTEAGQAIRNDKVAQELFSRVMEIMKDLYGEQYSSKKGIPKCVWSKIHLTFPSNEYYSDSTVDDTDIDDEDNSNPNRMLDPKHFNLINNRP